MSGRFYGQTPSGLGPCSSRSNRSDDGIERILVMLNEQREVIFNSQQQTDSLMMLCDNMTSEVGKLKDEVTTLQSKVNSKVDSASISPVNSKKGKGKLPKELSSVVKQLHDKLPQKFQSSESPHNQVVVSELVAQVSSEHSENFSKDQIKCATYRYYESRRRLFNDSQPRRVDQVKKNLISMKKKGYRKRLFERRSKVLKKDKERQYWLQLDENYMTEESCDEENDVIIRHVLPWASDNLQKLKSKLDKRHANTKLSAGRYKAKERIDGSPSCLDPPPHPVKWAIKPLSTATDEAVSTPPSQPVPRDSITLTPNSAAFSPLPSSGVATSSCSYGSPATPQAGSLRAVGTATPSASRLRLPSFTATTPSRNSLSSLLEGMDSSGSEWSAEED